MQRGETAMRELAKELEAMKLNYTVEKFLSSGSYGAVCAGSERSTGRPVAIKRVYATISDGKQVNILNDSFLAKRVLREVKLLSHFHHPNILGLRDLMIDLSVHDGKPKLYLVTELMHTDLAQVISDRRIVLSPEHIKYFMYSTLLGLKTLHDAGVVHRDLHPGNILLSVENDVKICDFNLAREDTVDDAKTHYVTHRWYRAPELVMQYKGFTKLVDVWSAGCVMAELYNRKAIFRGSTFYNQLNKIVEVVGTPRLEDVTGFACPSAREYLRMSLANVPPKPWNVVVPTAPPDALDLLSKLLTFNPTKRITVADALHHQFFAEIFDESDLTGFSAAPFHFDESVEAVPTMHRMFQDEINRFTVLKEQRASSMDALGKSQKRGEGLDGPGSPTLVSVGSAADGSSHVPRTSSFMNLHSTDLVHASGIPDIPSD